jgi:hypothetical protein
MNHQDSISGAALYDVVDQAFLAALLCHNGSRDSFDRAGSPFRATLCFRSSFGSEQHELNPYSNLLHLGQQETALRCGSLWFDIRYARKCAMSLVAGQAPVEHPCDTG